MLKDDRRRNTRVAFKTTADVEFPGVSFENRDTMDLSMNGVFIIGLIDRTLGDKCKITLHLAGGVTDISFNMSGEVTRITKDGIALHFHEMDLDSFHHLKNIVYYNADDPDEINDEYIDRSLNT
ncbi:MAG: PilZ domain-containing protein [Proteobacteria bacterium]|nr:PilZ domain-containing protein [Pseudomonadota bacterium]MBU1708766.1 PilZ domain-containing protein [Pseudomonadota bacterium]